MPFVEGVRLLQMFLVENAAPWIAEELLSYFVPNPIVGGMAENPRDRKRLVAVILGVMAAPSSFVLFALFVGNLSFPPVS